MVLHLKDTEYPSVPANVQAILEIYQAVFDAIQQQEDGVIRRSAAAFVGTAKYEVGDVVWYLAPHLVPRKTGKITKRWTGPWKIVRQATEVHYVIHPDSPTANIVEVTVQIRRLRHYTGDVMANHIPVDI